MKVVFSDQQRLEELDAAASGLPPAVIASLERKLVVIDAAPDERTLRNWKSLHYEKLQGDRKGQHSIRLNIQWRPIFKLDGSTTPPTIEILSVEDYH